MLNRHFREFIALLENHGVTYLIVGGYSVGFHGSPRYTGDLDESIAISEENAGRMMALPLTRKLPGALRGLPPDDPEQESGGRPAQVSERGDVAPADELLPNTDELQNQPADKNHPDRETDPPPVRVG